MKGKTRDTPLVPLCDLIETPLNPRKTFPLKGLEELSKSMGNGRGVIIPLLCRQNPDMRPGRPPYEIVDGARRFRAGKMASLDLVPINVAKLTDAEVIEMCAIASGQREDLHPLEEADAYKALLDLDYTVESIAEKIGKAEEHVYKRLRYLQLNPEARQFFLDGVLTPSHALQLARLERADDQKEMLEFAVRPETEWNEKKRSHVKTGRLMVVSVQELQHRIERTVFRALGTAAWVLDDATLVPKAGSCSACPKRTGANLALFEDIAADAEKCLDSVCWASKEKAQLIRVEAAIKADGAKPVRVSSDHGSGAGILGPHEWKPANDTKKCKGRAAGVIAYGTSVGRMVEVCIDRKCESHFGSIARAFGAPTPFAEQWATRRRNLDQRVKKLELLAVWNAVGAKVPIAPNNGRRKELLLIGRSIIARSLHDVRKALLAALELEPEAKKTSQSFDAPLLKLLDATRDNELVGLIVRLSLAPALIGFDTGALEAAAKGYGLNPAQISSKVAKPLYQKFEEQRKKAAANLKANPVRKKKAPAKRKAAAK